MNRKIYTFQRLRRQARLMGKTNMEKLESMKLAIVGCGRNGSFFSSLAAYAGMFRFSLIDPDVVMPHNVNASILFGHGDVGRKKVEVVKERIKAIDPAIMCDAYSIPAEESGSLHVLKSSDVIVSAVDSIQTKNFLNSLTSGLIRANGKDCLLDLASGAYVANGKILLLGGQATLFSPGGACLLCGSLVEGGVSNLSNVSLVMPNGFSALLGLELLVSYITGYDGQAGENREEYNFILYDCLSHQSIKLNRESRKSCKFCGAIKSERHS